MFALSLKQQAIKDPADTYRIVKKAFEKKINLVWLEPFGFNNTLLNRLSGLISNETMSELNYQVDKEE